MKTFSQICKLLESHGWSNGRGIYFGGYTSWSYTRNNKTIALSKKDGDYKVFVKIK